MSAVTTVNFLAGAVGFFMTFKLSAAETHAAAFLARRGAHALQRSSASDDLLQELERVVGHEHREFTESRLEPLEENLRPLVAAVHKDPATGNIGPAAVRYVLHRYFVQRHGWVVRGLDAAGDAWNNSSPACAFGPHTKIVGVQGLFQDQLNSYGFSLRQVAVFAATLESFVHAERSERLETVYTMLGLSRNNAIPSSDAFSALDYYMLMYVLDIDFFNATRFEVDEAFSTILDVYPSWPETVKFVHAIFERYVADGKADSLTAWSVMTSALDEIASEYGHWQNRECRSLKRALIELDDAGTGRVPLTSFYGSALNGTWQFLESPAYLRQLGALDDLDPARISVIIPNYVHSPTNCLASSRFYSVCCISECDELLGHLERSLGEPETEPGRIADLVRMLPSDTVSAPRTLSAALVRRLRDIADRHSGRVPLHSRLFAQWMHHVYPRECPYPHLSGTVKPQPPTIWMKETGEDVVASEEEMQGVVESTGRRWMTGAGGGVPHERLIDAEADGDLPWSSEEELFISRPIIEDSEGRLSLFARVGRSMFYFSAACCFGLIVLRSLGATDGFACGSPGKHYL